MLRGLSVTTRTARETVRLGTLLAGELRGGEVLALTGNLGAGKTTFVKGLAKGLGVHQTITSPTFVLMKVYRAKRGKIRQLVHVDCYRVPGVELSAIGLEDYLGDPRSVVAVEWAGKLSRRIFSAEVQFAPTKQLNERIVTVRWSTRRAVPKRRAPARRPPTAGLKASRRTRIRQRPR